MSGVQLHYSLAVQCFGDTPQIMNRVAALFVLALLAVADASGQSNSFSPGQARDAVEKGDVVPLRDVFRSLERRYGGYQIDAGLFNARGGQEYRITWMGGAGEFKGRRMKIVVDAQTGRIKSVSGG